MSTIARSIVSGLAMANAIKSVGAGAATSPSEVEVGHGRGVVDYELTPIFDSVSGLTFNCRMAGPEDGKPVIMLHGFPECACALLVPVTLVTMLHLDMRPHLHAAAHSAPPRTPTLTRTHFSTVRTPPYLTYTYTYTGTRV
jgi:hypothetical protein